MVKYRIVAAACLLLASDAAWAQLVAERSCDQFLLAPREANGKRVGPKSCLMQETGVTLDGRTFTRRVEHFKGTPENPLDPAEMRDKFLRLTRRYPEGDMVRLFTRLQQLENEPNLDWLHAGLT